MCLSTGPWLRATSTTAVSSKYSVFAFSETRSVGSRSMSTPSPASRMPGLVKFDCPSSFEERRLASTPLRLRRGATPPQHTPPPPPGGARVGAPPVGPRRGAAPAADQRHGLADPVAGVGAGDLRILEN